MIMEADIRMIRLNRKIIGNQGEGGVQLQSHEYTDDSYFATDYFDVL